MAFLAILPWTVYGQHSPETEAATLIIQERFDKVELKAVFALLEKKYNLRLSYEEAAIEGVRVDCRLQKADLGEAMSQLLRGTSLDFRIVDSRHVMIRSLPHKSDMEGPQEGRLLSGRVLDAQTGEPLPFANLILSGNNTGTAADASGRFKLPLPPTDGDLVLRAQYLGYGPRLIRMESADFSSPVTIKLFPQVQEIPGITVKEQAPLLSLQVEESRWRIDAQQLKTLPDFAGGADLFRSLQLLPGIDASDDLTAGLRIRGSGSEENLILLDGITLYRVDHFFGVFSAINPKVVGQVDLYKNAFPAEYGGRTGGVLAIGTRNASPSEERGAMEVNLLTSNAYLQLPIASNLQLLLGGRISNGDISGGSLFGLVNQERLRSAKGDNPMSTLTRSAFLSQTPDFRFYDFNGSLQWQWDTGGSMDLNLFRSYDRYRNYFENGFSNFFHRIPVENREIYDELGSWSNTGYSFRVRKRWNDQFSSRLTVSRSLYQNRNDLEATLQRSTPFRGDTSITATNLNDNSIEGIDWHFESVWKARDDNQLKFGYQGLTQRLSYHLGIDGRPLLRDEHSANTHALYLEWDGQFAKQWGGRAGLRSTYYSPGEKVYFSPRFQLRFSPAEGLWLHSSWSRYFQFLRQVDYETRFGSSQPFYVLADENRFPVARSNHFSAGILYSGLGFGVEMEYFRKNTSGVLDYALLRTGFEPEQEGPARQLNYVAFKGEGFTQGLDVLLRKTGGIYTGWIAYTLSKAANRFPEILNGRSFPASNDRRHQLQLVNQLHLGDWNLSATYVFASGRPYTDLADLARLRLPSTDRRELLIENRLSYLDDYHRIDLGAFYEFPVGRTAGRLGLSVFNLFNRQNVKYRQYVFAIPESLQPGDELRSTPIGTELEMLDRTLNFSFEWRF
jgi:ferric enterobactin receptor